jgi:hypothetical protein
MMGTFSGNISATHDNQSMNLDAAIDLTLFDLAPAFVQASNQQDADLIVE